MSDKEYKGWLIVAFIISLIAGIGLMTGTIISDILVGTGQTPAEGCITIVIASSIIMYAASFIELIQVCAIYKELKEFTPNMKKKEKKEKEFICKDCENCFKIEKKSGVDKYYTYCLNADGLTYDSFYDNIIYCKRFQEKK